MSDFSYFQNPEEAELIQKIQDYCYYQRESAVINFPFLRFNIRHIQREHDGWCSELDYQRTDDVKDAKTEIKIITLEVPVPKYLIDKDGLLKVAVDDDFNLINNEKTEKLFQEWITSSNCDGSGYCGLYDTFIPINIQYITY